MKYFYIAIFTIISFSNVIRSQPMLNGKKSIDIPFEYVNNFIIVNVLFNKKLPLKFIFDTGAEYTILTKRQYSDISGFQYEREFKIVGADLTTEITAYLARGVTIKITKLFVPVVDILVFQEDFFQFEELMGVEVHGIIGANIFGNYVLGINYKKRVITLHDPSQFNPPKEKYSVSPITIIRNKPYLMVNAKLNNISDSIALKLLLDTGASLSLLLYTDTHKGITVPPNVIKGNIGMGLGGFLEGFLGRIKELGVANLALNNIITNFQEIEGLLDTTFLNGRNGVIGNEILNRFEIIIDYQNRKLFLKPNKKFKKAFEYDKSGLTLIASGKDLNIIVVNDVVSESPADQAGIKIGDIIHQVNWFPPGYFSMKDLIRIFHKKEGKRIKLKVKRDGKKMKFQFNLRKLI